MRKGTNIIAYLSAMLLVVAITFVMLEERIGAIISSLITTIITTIGAVLIWIQMRRNSVKVSVELIGNLNTVLLKSEGILNLRDKLAKSDNPKDFSVDGKIGGKDTTKDLDNFMLDDSINIIEYLEFFENLGEMYFSGAVKIEDMDRCFGQMFFVAYNNKYMQDREIVPYKQHYVKSIMLYKDWYHYRIKNNIEMPYKDNPLNYQQLLEEINETQKLNK